MNQIKKEIEKETKGKKIVVGVSTGVDSMVLLSLLLEVKKKEEIIIAHIHHGVREQSDEEEQFIKTFADEKGIKIYIKHGKFSNSNFEEEARNFRYQFFKKVLHESDADMIITGHHADDEIETILMRLLHKSSLEAYQGMKKIYTEKNITFYHPFLDIPKENILAYAKDHSIPFYHDITNDENDHLRNRIRHFIVPALKKESPNLYDAIAYFRNEIQEASRFINSYRDQFIKESTFVHTNGDIEIQREAFEHLDSYLKKQVLFHLLKQYKCSTGCIDDLLKQIASNKKIMKDFQNLTLVVEYNTILITKQSAPQSFFLVIENEGDYCLPNNATLLVQKNKCTYIQQNLRVCYNINSYPIIIRSRENEDKLQRLNKKTNETFTQTLSNYLTNRKIPYLKRRNLLVLVENKKIIAILGEKEQFV